MLAADILTPSQIEANERSKRFRANIAKRAAEISPEAQLRALSVERPTRPFEPLPPIPNSAIAEAVDIVFPDWVNDIIKIRYAVAKEWGVSRIDLVSARRTRNVTVPRQVGMFLCRKLTRRSLPEIGRGFGNRDHTTVHHAVHVIERAIARDEQFRARVYALAESLGGSLDGQS